MKPINFKVGRRKYSVGYLLTTKAVKTIKGEKMGYLTAVLYLDTSVNPRVICPAHTVGCLASCLKSSGNLGLIDGQSAIRARAHYFLNHRAEFLDRLKEEITYWINQATKKGLIPAIRLNGSSDIPWENEKFGAIPQWITANFPDSGVKIYDYTKIVGRALPLYLKTTPYYDVTFSWSGHNQKQCEKLLQLGVNVAVPFDIKRGKELPAEFLGRPVIDGDLHDLRFLDQKGVVVGLRYKLTFDKPTKGRKLVKSPDFIVAVN